MLGLEGKALLWFQWQNKRKPIANWRVLKKMMLRHFRGRKEGSLIDQWLSVQQDSDVEEYEKKIIQYVSNIDEEVSEVFLLANFIRGLKAQIQLELRLMVPLTMEEAME